MFKKDDTLASESASKEDEDGARLERFSVLCGFDGLAGLLIKLAI